MKKSQDMPTSDPELVVTVTQETPDARALEPKSTASLFRDLTTELSALFTAEIALVRTELQETVVDAKKAAVKFAVGAAVALVGGLVMVATLILVLALFLPAWLASLIVAVVFLAVGGIALLSGKSTVDDMTVKPERSVASLEADKDLLKEHVSS